MYHKLTEHSEANDGKIAISEITDSELSQWCKIQYYKGDSLPTEKIEMLQDIGFCFAPSWNEMYKRLTAYIFDNGSVTIDKDHDPELSRWVQKQRGLLTKHRMGMKISLSEEQVNQLNSLEISKGRSTWNELYERLVAYKENKGHIHVEKEDDNELCNWVKRQRRLLAKQLNGEPGGMSDDQINQLKLLGLDKKKSAFECRWESMFNKIVQYKQDNGHFPKPTVERSAPKDEKELSRWVKHQKNEYKKLQDRQESSLTAQHLQRLTEIGLNLTPTFKVISWSERMDSLRQFVEGKK